jgi:hypothetical protein
VPPGCTARARELRKRRRQRPGRRPVPGPDCASRITRRPPRDSAATASRCCGSSRPDDLATELNPHHAVPGGQPHKGDQNGAFRAGAVRWAAGHGHHKGSGA